MAAVLVPTKNMTREEWLAWRRKGIGGSDAAAIAGVSRYKSPVEVWLEKTGQVPPEEQGEPAYWGRVLEDVVAREWSRRTKKKVKRRLAILRHRHYPFMVANVDRLVIGEKAGLEVKTTGAQHRDEWENGRVPDEYVIQVQHYMAVTGFPVWYVAVLIGGQEFRWTTVPREEELIRYLIKIEADFWRLVETRVMPDLDGSRAATELITSMYPQAEPGKKVILPEEARELIAQYDQAKEQEAYWAERKAEAENRLKALMGDAEIGWCGDRKVTWKNIPRTDLDRKKLKAEMPEIYERFTYPNPYRRFEVR